MPLNYVLREWSGDLDKNELTDKWRLRAAHTEDLKMLILQPAVNFSLTEDELELWSRYNHWYEQREYELAKPYWDKLVASIKARGLLRTLDDLKEVRRKLEILAKD